MAAPLQDSSLRTGRSGQRLAAVTRPGFAGQYEKGNNKIDRNQYSKGSARAGKTVIHRISVRASGSCRGLRPCPLCHLCPATATAADVAASCPKQHRPSEERPLVPRCEVQRHHPPKGSCRGYINLVIIRYLCTSEVPLSHLSGEDVHELPASSFGVGSRFSSSRLPYACLSSKYSFL